MADRDSSAVVLGASMGGLLAARALSGHFAHVTKMEAPDQSTVVLHLDTPIASFLSDIEGRMIVSKHAYDTMGEDKANHAMIGTGLVSGPAA